MKGCISVDKSFAQKPHEHKNRGALGKKDFKITQILFSTTESSFTLIASVAFPYTLLQDMDQPIFAEALRVFLYKYLFIAGCFPQLFLNPENQIIGLEKPKDKASYSIPCGSLKFSLLLDQQKTMQCFY